MANVSDLENTPRSGLNHIDALLDKGPDWNFLTTGPANTIYYTFSISSGNEKDVTGQEAFTQAQQIATRGAFDYLQQLTGIQFVETANGASAQLHLANLDIEGSNTTGLCSWNAPYTYGVGNTLIDYKPQAYVYLDNFEWRFQNRDLEPGGVGYQTLLHELGHALGLKHPFEDDVHLPVSQDNTRNTLMSYTDSGGPYSTFSPYDIAALNWLYGGDGLRGALGINSTTGGRYITGTSAVDRLTGTAFDDVLAGAGGNDIIDGGAGVDTVSFGRVRGEYTFSQDASGNVLASHASLGTVTISNVEQFSFVDGKYQRAQVLSDSTPPAVPSLSVTKNAANFTSFSKPLFTGQAEANATVRIYVGERMVAETQADAKGLYSVVATTVFNDGLNYSVRATATDAAGNVSAFSEAVGFNVDATAPVKPTSTMTLATSSNQPVFSGTAEANSTIKLYRVDGDRAIEIGRTVTKGDGSWKLDSAALPNGVYKAIAASEDIAGNATSASDYLNFTIDSTLSQTGTAQNDRITNLGVGNNAVDGAGGRDTVVYAGLSEHFTLKRGVYGVTVTDTLGNLGTDNLINVERIQFNDTWKALDVDGIAGQAYRMYEAALGRAPEKAGLSYWIWRMENGSTIQQVASDFMKTTEFAGIYGANPTDAQFIRQMYLNILDREPDAGGYVYWEGRIATGSREQILVDFSESPENKAQVIAAIQDGMDYSPWA
ncbi:DUF4214 domain-containing protein [Massilia sp. IC2-477]|uniref:DUF4214 domain-containing protein n=1 Tax=Massilia sp. IC2-477 TaxID=2887198 RepID=UPI001D12B687|nr:DUF4214 domain-containing protein [Massilia sp. IC2-477]MCC2954762.1 DUF4214 domain-containing protein [Massilia sp. IC2-477]